ncbi:MAG: L-aspartate oxidase [Thermodesulfobacteriota bacterium]
MKDLNNRELSTDFLIIGSGLAGLYAANYASKFGDVILVTKSTLIESNSYWAQGGIAAALDPEDSPTFHKEDTINAGRGLCNIDAVDVLVKEGKERVLGLIELGMEFDSNEEGLLFGLEGGHSKRRVLHAGGNSTGENIVEFLISSVTKNLKIKILELTTITDLISDGKNCFGAWAYDEKKSEYVLIRSGSTILATGGASALFKRTTNPEGSTGEGIDLAYRAGAELMDMEFIQFHPTAFYTENGETFLITEAVRGEGAHLVNIDGKRFMKNYHNLGELAPRDVVSKAIYNEISESGYNYVYLALSHMERSFIIKRFANIYSLCLRNGFDLTCDLIPVAPAAHYTIGGVRTGLDGETNLAGFYACGEVACTGVHGANRLASNSLLECLVFAKRAVDESLNNNVELTTKPQFGLPTLISETSKGYEEKFTILKDRILDGNDINLGIVRDGDSLNSYISDLEEIKQDADKLTGWFKYKISSMANVSMLIANSAYIRNESRGSHIRADFPDENVDLQFHFYVKADAGPYKASL